MNMRLLAAFSLIAALSAATALAREPVPYLPVPHDAAVILNTGSTNASGYRIVVQRNGNAEYTHAGQRAKHRLSAALATQFFTNLERAMPLSRLATGRCMKSASFGTETFVWWRGQRSPDVSCPGGDKAEALQGNANAVATQLGLFKVTLPANEPRRAMPMPSPTSS